MSSRAYDWRADRDLVQREIRRTVGVRRNLQTGSLQWEIIAVPDGVDRRTCDRVYVAAGYPDNVGARDVSIRVGNRVAVLEPVEVSALGYVLLSVNTAANMAVAKL